MIYSRLEIFSVPAKDAQDFGKKKNLKPQLLNVRDVSEAKLVDESCFYS